MVRELQEKYLLNLKEYGLESIAMKYARINSETLEEWLQDESFQKECEDAIMLSVESLEAMAIDVAKHGRKVPVFYRGKQVFQRNPETGDLLIDPETLEYIPAYEYKYDDSLLKFFLQGNKKKYKEGGELQSIANKPPTQININLISHDNKSQILDITPTELEKLPNGQSDNS